MLFCCLFFFSFLLPRFGLAGKAYVCSLFADEPSRPTSKMGITSQRMMTTPQSTQSKYASPTFASPWWRPPAPDPSLGPFTHRNHSPEIPFGEGLREQERKPPTLIPPSSIFQCEDRCAFEKNWLPRNKRWMGKRKRGWGE